jgi:hypothetical protein
MTASSRRGTIVVTTSTTPTHVYPAGNLAMADGMLTRVAMTVASRNTLRPLRLLSDSCAVAPIESNPSRTLFHGDGLDTLEAYPTRARTCRGVSYM